VYSFSTVNLDLPTHLRSFLFSQALCRPALKMQIVLFVEPDRRPLPLPPYALSISFASSSVGKSILARWLDQRFNRGQPACRSKPEGGHRAPFCPS